MEKNWILPMKLITKWPGDYDATNLMFSISSRCLTFVSFK